MPLSSPLCLSPGSPLCLSLGSPLCLSLGALILLARGCGASAAFLNYSGDLMLGALVPVHRKGSASDICGLIQLEDGIQTLEVMLFTLKQINLRKDILPGIQLGLLAYDSCEDTSRALEQSMDFVKGFVSHLNMFHDDPDFLCRDGSPAQFRGGVDQVVAVIGGLSSSVTIQLSTLMHMFKVPQVSYMSTSASLSNRDKYPYFFRTVPSDVFQVQAMLELLRDLNWTYVAVIYSESDYGRHGFDMLRTLASNYSVCIASPVHSVSMNSFYFNEEKAAEIVKSINKTETKVVVVYSESFQSCVAKLLLTARDLNVFHRFTWLFTDLWTEKSFKLLMENNNESWQEDFLDGSMLVQPKSVEVLGFDEYFLALKQSNQKTNPWWREFTERYFGCGRRSNDKCQNPNSTVSDVKGRVSLQQARYLHYVRDAVWAVGQALTDMHREKCGGRPGLCSNMRHIRGSEFKDYISKVEFQDDHDQLFSFLDGGDGPPRYSILNYRFYQGTFQWTSVGEYKVLPDMPRQQHLSVRRLSIQSRGGGAPITSICTPLCRDGQIRVPKSDSCCWGCRTCGEFQVRYDERSCEDCPAGYRPSRDHGVCLQLPEEHIDYSHPYAIAAMTVASVGLVGTLLVSAVFWTHRNTPVIKAAGRELSAVLLVALMGSFLLTFVMVAPPTATTCGLTRFFLGFCFTLSYATLLTKTNRISRIFNHRPGSGPKKTKYTSPGVQIMITTLLTLVEALINVIWQALVPPTIRFYFPSRDVRQRICDGLDDKSYLVGLAYPLILIVFCVWYAIKTRKCPGGFNETRHIAFTTYTVTVIWLAFVPLYLASTSAIIRTATLAMSLSLSGLVQLGCLFCPKVYIVILKPQKNTKEEVMMSNWQRAAGSSTGTHAAHVNASFSTHRAAESASYDFEQWPVVTTELQ